MYLDAFFIQKILLNSLNFTGFADSSNQGYVGVIYARLIANKEIKVKLLALKTRVTPAKPLTIPRLELLSCLLLGKLLKLFTNLLSMKLQ